MRADEARHGAMAYEAGGLSLPAPVPSLMRACASVMKAIAARV
jgi:ubiquinone biosynthesis monooxygenase Coq7